MLRTVLKIMAEKGKTVKFKIYTRRLKSSFIIYADFVSILVSENIGKQNPNESNTNKYFKSYLGQDDVYKFITSMVKESKYCIHIL